VFEFLLDTHVWIWHAEGDVGRVGRRTVRLLKRAVDDDTLRVSPVTVFELSSLYASGRVQLARTLEQWIVAGLEEGGVRVAPLSAEAALDAGRIGSTRLPDPIDRLLVATARQMDATLVTRDRRVLDYARATSAVRVHDAGV
jgi:PIN domain nuclease of toxin-antitoxin system